MTKPIYDIAIVGGGIIGCSVLRQLSLYDGIKICLLEANLDVADGASKANSGIVHAGYDCVPNTLKAKFNVRGNKLYPQLCKQLNLPLLNCGSIVVAPKDGLDGLKELEQRGIKNGVDVKILGREELLKIEPNVSDSMQYALYAKDACVVSPYRFTIAMADSAILNGAEIYTDFSVNSITKEQDVFTISAGDKSIKAKYIINAAGCFAPYINDLCGGEQIPQVMKKGEYLLLDSKQRKNINTIIFPLPTKAGKGILVAPTISGNVIYGPTSDQIEKFDRAVTAEGLAKIKASVQSTYKSFDFSQVIKVYAGVRAISGEDFVIGFSQKVEGLYMLAGICSPGISAAPAIAEETAKVFANLFKVKQKQDITPLPQKPSFIKLTDRQKEEFIAKDPTWGHIICRCEKVTEAEVIAAIHSPLPAVTTDAIKRRVRAGMGRCSGGFCLPEVMQIISKELGIPLSQVKKESSRSNLMVGEIKEVRDEKL